MDSQYKFQDILKKGFTGLDVFNKISPMSVITCLIMTLIAAVFIFYVYKYTFRGVVYSYTFNMALVPMCLLTALIIQTISSNVVLSLGMVGALSIVRFRTALKDPMDIIFMFWVISVGIASGAGVYSISLIGSLFTGAVIFIMSRQKIDKSSYMMILHYTDDATDKVNQVLGKLKYELKSKTVAKGVVEFTAEVRVKANNTAFITEFSEIEGVFNAALVTYNGDYAS